MNLRHLLLVAMLFLSLVLMAQDDSQEMGVITGSRVNVRGRPLGTAEVCCQLKKGDEVKILERRLVQTTGTNTEEWVRIVLPEKAVVWLQTAFLTEDGAVTSKVNGRAGPGLMWPVLCVFSKGYEVTLQTNHLEWTGVIPPPTASAWISGRYVRNQSDEPPAVPATPVTPE